MLNVKSHNGPLFRRHWQLWRIFSQYLRQSTGADALRRPEWPFFTRYYSYRNAAAKFFWRSTLVLGLTRWTRVQRTDQARPGTGESREETGGEVTGADRREMELCRRRAEEGGGISLLLGFSRCRVNRSKPHFRNGTLRMRVLGETAHFC